MSDILELVKARLSFLVLITTLVGYLIGLRGPIDALSLTATLLGTALCACGAAALNQWWERDLDGRMKRTRNRPLPSGRIHAENALAFGLLLCGAGIALLGLLVNTLSASLSAITILSYVFVYTPLKRITSLNTIVGAVPGALPPLIGYAAATNTVGIDGWILFSILFMWQMPHFLAIAWMYREDYARAGFKMLSLDDVDASSTARQSVIYCMGLLVVSLLPAVDKMVQPIYFLGALALGLGFLAVAVKFAVTRTNNSARLLFFASILYLPLLLGCLVLSRR